MPNMPAVFREYKRLERLREVDGLEIEELERWTQLKRILAAHFDPGAPADISDKRASLRIPTHLRVSFHSYGELRQCLMTNISRGGVFIATTNPLPVGSPFELRIHIEESDETVELHGEVVAVNTGPDMRGEGVGMGIRFANLDAEQEAMVRELYGRALDAALSDAPTD